jgi:hypothetical protein
MSEETYNTLRIEAPNAGTERYIDDMIARTHILYIEGLKGQDIALYLTNRALINKFYGDQ